MAGVLEDHRKKPFSLVGLANHLRISNATVQLPLLELSVLSLQRNRKSTPACRDRGEILPSTERFRC
jgi:hypothetical protein